MLWPVRFVSDVPAAAPVRVVLRGKSFVLWRDASAAVRCAPDACPHRLSMLSAGRVERGDLVCRHHDWRFAGDGACVRVPQVGRGSIPKACNLELRPVTVMDGVVWLADDDACRAGTPTNLLAALGPRDVVTDRRLASPTSYRLQVENALDVAHINTVHAGFQGSRERVGPIHLSRFYEDADVLACCFAHDSETPDVDVVFLKPGVVVVRVLDKATKRLLRTNVVHVAPETDASCSVLFRDVAHDSNADPTVHRWLTALIVDGIFAQDVAVTQEQLLNQREFKHGYCLPAPADRPLAAFRSWCSSVGLL